MRVTTPKCARNFVHWSGWLLSESPSRRSGSQSRHIGSSRDRYICHQETVPELGRPKHSPTEIASELRGPVVVEWGSNELHGYELRQINRHPSRDSHSVCCGIRRADHSLTLSEIRQRLADPTSFRALPPISTHPTRGSRHDFHLHLLRAAQYVLHSDHCRRCRAPLGSCIFELWPTIASYPADETSYRCPLARPSARCVSAREGQKSSLHDPPMSNAVT